ncbi:hypothetical protein DLAC_11755 [Tieghemostelium lacteum]|uniref:Uncharacterized protein n=1 Tax=Tieghemostelium lacteum TaxID=361077 RepID=A0A151Z8V5_TIELA|nr:hypothetical protein DLAC_11755 [Tieghemostelium lacteum]|eukprot:KYQ90378.1 hypothetical protein DLAC_11755 [Tieghemostelium lacteum]
MTIEKISSVCKEWKYHIVPRLFINRLEISNLRQYNECITLLEKGLNLVVGFKYSPLTRMLFMDDEIKYEIQNEFKLKLDILQCRNLQSITVFNCHRYIIKEIQSLIYNNIGINPIPNGTTSTNTSPDSSPFQNLTQLELNFDGVQEEIDLKDLIGTIKKSQDLKRHCNINGIHSINSSNSSNSNHITHCNSGKLEIMTFYTWDEDNRPTVESLGMLAHINTLTDLEISRITTSLSSIISIIQGVKLLKNFVIEWLQFKPQLPLGTQGKLSIMNSIFDSIANNTSITKLILLQPFHKVSIISISQCLNQNRVLQELNCEVRDIDFAKEQQQLIQNQFESTISLCTINNQTLKTLELSVRKDTTVSIYLYWQTKSILEYLYLPVLDEKIYNCIVQYHVCHVKVLQIQINNAHLPYLIEIIKLNHPTLKELTFVNDLIDVDDNEASHANTQNTNNINQAIQALCYNTQLTCLYIFDFQVSCHTVSKFIQSNHPSINEFYCQIINNWSPFSLVLAICQNTQLLSLRFEKIVTQARENINQFLGFVTRILNSNHQLKYFEFPSPTCLENQIDEISPDLIESLRLSLTQNNIYNLSLSIDDLYINSSKIFNLLDSFIIKSKF